MVRPLEIDERYDWLRATLEHLASVPTLNDDDLGYVVFEVLDVDVRSCLHDSNLHSLVTARRIPASMEQELLGIRSVCLPLIDARRPSSEIRADERWQLLSRRCATLLIQFVRGHNEPKA